MNVMRVLGICRGSKVHVVKKFLKKRVFSENFFTQKIVSKFGIFPFFFLHFYLETRRKLWLVSRCSLSGLKVGRRRALR